MAQWVLFENKRRCLTLLYKNPTGTQVCGDLRKDTPGNMILDWVMKTPAVRTGDFIVFPDGTVIPVLPGAMA
jgi:hypothetical protein